MRHYLIDMAQQKKGVNSPLIHELVNRYKIHLMPKDENFMQLIVDLCRFLNDGELGKYICDFKIKPVLETNPLIEKYKAQGVPKIVLYIDNGKKDAQEALRLVYERYGSWKGLDRAPAYNAKGTSLIYVTQGNRNDKLEEANKKYYEQPGMVYFKSNVTGKEEDYHLVDPGTGKRL